MQSSQRIRLFFFYLFSYCADKELCYVSPMKAPSGLPVGRRDSVEFDMGAPFLFSIPFFVHVCVCVCVGLMFNRGHGICRYSAGHYAG